MQKNLECRLLYRINDPTSVIPKMRYEKEAEKL